MGAATTDRTISTVEAPDVEGFRCSACRATFPTAEALERHQRIAHFERTARSWSQPPPREEPPDLA
jgi:hypothetical protein